MIRAASDAGAGAQALDADGEYRRGFGDGRHDVSVTGRSRFIRELAQAEKKHGRFGHSAVETNRIRGNAVWDGVGRRPPVEATVIAQSFG